MGCGSSKSTIVQDGQAPAQAPAAAAAAAPAAAPAAAAPAPTTEEAAAPPPAAAPRAPTAELKLATALSAYVPRVVLNHFHANPAVTDKATIALPNAALAIVDVSGFTAMSEFYAKSGRAGVEQMTTHLNGYFSKMIELIEAYNGDVVKFAGDALICVFASKDALASAATCALALQRDCGVSKVEGGDVEMTIHIGMAYGDLELSITGLGDSELHSHEFFITGAPKSSIAATVDSSSSGEIVLCGMGVAGLAGRAEFAPVSKGDTKGACRRLIRMTDTSVERSTAEVRNVSEAMLPMLRKLAPSPVSTRIEAGLAGFLSELRRVSIVFVNMPGMLTSSASEIHDVLIKLQVVTTQLSGYRRQFIIDDKGPVLIVVFGTPPHSHADDAFRATKCALLMTAILSAAKVEHGIGLTTGEVYSGAVGSSQRREHCVVGDRVNMSARLANKAKNSVLMDEASATLADTRVRIEKRERIAVKGKKDTVETFEPLEVIANVASVHVLPLVGLDKAMGRAADALRAGRGYVAIHGGIGSGKSRVAAEAAQRADVRVVHHGVDATEAVSPYCLAIPLVRDVLVGDVAALARKALDKETLLPFAGLLVRLGIKMPADMQSSKELELLEASAMHAKLGQVVAALIRAQKEPLLIIAEDIHHADSSSLVVLGAIVTAEIPGIVVVSTRQQTEGEDKAAGLFGGEADVATEPLSVAQVGTLTASAIGADGVEQKVAKTIADLAEGSPFFSIELAEHFVAKGAVAVDGATGKATAKFDAVVKSVPRTVTAVLQARMDALKPMQQVVGRVGSVLGLNVDIDALAKIEDVSDQAMLDALVDLSTENIVTVPDTASKTSAFRSQLVRDVLYESMLHEKRAAMHQRVAELIESRGREDNLAAIASHYERACLMQTSPPTALLKKAHAALYDAASAAMELFSMKEATDYFKRAVAIAELIEKVEPAADKRKSAVFDSLIRLAACATNSEGLGSPLVHGTFARANELLTSMTEEDDTADMAPLIWGMRLFQCVFGQYGASCAINDRLARLSARIKADAKADRDPKAAEKAAGIATGIMMQSHHGFTQCKTIQALPKLATVHTRGTMELFDPVRDAGHWRVYGGTCPFVEAAAWHALTARQIGNWVDARTVEDNAVAMMKRTGNLSAADVWRGYTAMAYVMVRDFNGLADFFKRNDVAMPENPSTPYHMFIVLAFMILGSFGRDAEQHKAMVGKLDQIDGFLSSIEPVVTAYAAEACLAVPLFIILAVRTGDKSLVDRAAKIHAHNEKLAESHNALFTLFTTRMWLAEGYIKVYKDEKKGMALLKQNDEDLSSRGFSAALAINTTLMGDRTRAKSIAKVVMADAPKDFVVQVEEKDWDQM